MTDDKRVVITGGAGFVGSTLALGLKARHPDWHLVAADNLYRRGSELNLSRLRQAGVEFRHADVRIADDVMGLGPADVIIEAAAEPSVLAGIDGGGSQLVQTNLVGAQHCFELAARHGSQVVFLSTSRVYPVEALAGLRLKETQSRFELADEQSLPGVSPKGISEDFPLNGARTLYGATKLAAELLLTEYVQTHGLRAVINRCGVIAGPWQMGKVDQGVAAHWMFSHMNNAQLSYIGFGGKGQQVRDMLHADDLLELVDLQLGDPQGWSGKTFNVGGGRDVSVSLSELTEICDSITGNTLDLGHDPNDRPGDIPVYLSDCSALFAHSDWRPRRDAREIMADIHSWALQNADVLRSALGQTDA